MDQGRDSPWVLTGDFNDILDNSEKSGGPSRCEGSFIPFRSFVSMNGLWDVKLIIFPGEAGGISTTYNLVWTEPLRM